MWPVLIAVGALRWGTLGCDAPEAYRLRGSVGAGAAGVGVAGATAGTAGAAVGGSGGDVLAGTAGVAGLAGSSGAAGAGDAGAPGAAGDVGSAGGRAGAGAAGATGGAGGGAAGGGGAGGKAGASGAAGAGQGGGGAGGGAAGAGGSGGAAGAPVNDCDRSRWTATASVTTGDGAGPPGGIDGDLTTRWGNNHGQNGTDYYTVSFGGTVKLSKITLNNTMAYPDDYPGAYAVYGSSDGTTFDAAPFVTGNGTTGSTVITFAQRSVRAVRVNQTGTTRSTNWWQIGEFQVVCSP